MSLVIYAFKDVATYPSTGGRKDQNGLAKAFASKGENTRIRHQSLFGESVRKTKKTKVYGF